MLGCGTHTAAVVDRDGQVVTNLDRIVDVTWDRVLNDTSMAHVRVEPTGSCCDRLAGVRTWRHNLIIWRDGRLVWEGPIARQIRWTTRGAELSAAGITSWLDRRVPHDTVRFRGVDVMDVAEWLIADGFRPDDPGHQVRVVRPAGVPGDRDYERDVGQTLDHLRDLAAAGVDWTEVGRQIVLLPDQFCEQVGSLSDTDFPDGIEIVEDGVEVATRWVVWGETPDGAPVKGEIGGIDAYYGLLERSVEDRAVPTMEAAVAAARSRLRTSIPAPVFVDSQTATLSPQAPVDLRSLVPGWCVSVATTATCRPVTQTLKLLAVQVTESAEGETVTVTLAPTGVV